MGRGVRWSAISLILPFAGASPRSTTSQSAIRSSLRLIAPAPAPQPGAMELRQLYVLRPWHGRGVAEELMKWAIDTARAEGAPEIYLTVFDHNMRAKRFYTRHGFSEVGHCTFRLGDRVDDDRVWRKTVSGSSSS